MLKQLERWGRRQLVWLLCGLKRRKAALPDKVEKVLVVRQDERLGNLILITPFLENLKKIYPDATVAVVAPAVFSDIVRYHPAVSRVFEVRKREFALNPLSFFKLILQLRRERFDIAFDLSHFDSVSVNNILYTLLPAPRFSVGFDRGKGSEFLDLSVPTPDGAEYEAYSFLRLLEPFSSVVRIPPRVYIDDRSRISAQKFFDENKLEAKIIGLHIGGRGRKKLPVGFWEDFLLRFPDLPKVVFWGKTEEKDVEYLKKRDIPNTYFFPLSPVLTVGAALEKLSVFVSCDTGIMHLAGCIQPLHQIGIFVSSDAARFSPRKQNFVAISGEPNLNELIEKMSKILDTI
ncbi:glycosyltransferase family 9 protein [bacterium]|nr:glycosyltransferase family 9 protein [bacterium]